ncbi:MAG: FixH family protein, partial [Polyangiaceae bacterium]
MGLRAAPSLCLVAMLALAGCGDSSSSSTSETFGAEPLQTLTSNSGNFDIDVRTSPSQPPSRGEASVQLVIRDKNGAPHSGLTLSVTPWMPAMGHGASVTPSV